MRDPSEAIHAPEVRIHRVEAASREVVERVARGMRATLIEVLGEERGVALYDFDWLCDRVRAHVDPLRLDGALFLADSADGAACGHLLARPEQDELRTIGLIATVFVEPERRGRGLASRLFDAGEEWLRARGFAEFAYDTADNHHAMISMLQSRGYAVSHRATEHAMLRLSRRY